MIRLRHWDDFLVAETPVVHAAAAGEVSLLRYLLDHGGDAAMPNAKGRTPLHNAAQNGVSLPSMDGLLTACSVCLLFRISSLIDVLILISCVQGAGRL